MDTSTVLMGLSPQQLEAVTSPGAPLCIIAGAGSGKTRVLTRRIAWRSLTGSADPRHVLALTFTRKAAQELRYRLKSLGMRDLASAGTFHGIAYASLRRWWADTGQPQPAITKDPLRLLREVLAKQYSPRATLELSVEVSAEIAWAKSRNIIPADYEASAGTRSGSLERSEVAAHYARYEAEKRKRRVMDLDDLVNLCSIALESDAAFASAQRWRFRHLFVDEAQDLNPSQWRLLQAWQAADQDLCVVGDPHQAIYSWNGAAPELLDAFSLRYPTAVTVHLDENWRSTPQILEIASAVAVSTTTHTSMAMPFRPGIAKQADGPLPTLTEYQNEEAEADAVAKHITSLRFSSFRWEDIAVLARTNSQLEIVRDALRSMALPLRYAPFESDIQVTDASTTVAPTLRGASRASRRTSSDGWQTNGVALSTFHRAKGLEWKVVFLVGLEDGLSPLWRSTAPQAEAEERRLLYVAMTRATNELHCSWASNRRLDRSTRTSRRMSPYLRPVKAVLNALSNPIPTTDAVGLIAEMRSVLQVQHSSPLHSDARPIDSTGHEAQTLF